MMQLMLEISQVRLRLGGARPSSKRTPPGHPILQYVPKRPALDEALRSLSPLP
jgi:hypothetical protein